MHYVSISDLSIYSNWLYCVMDQNTELLYKNRELQNVLSLSKHEVVKLKSVLKNAWLADADISEGIKLLDKK
jgi:hypothetical protein